MAAPGQHLRPEDVEEIERHIREEVATGGTATGAARKHGGRSVTYQKIAKQMRSEGRLKDADEHYVAAFSLHGESEDAAAALGIPFEIYVTRLHDIARKGGMGTKPVLPGFRVSKTTAVTDADGDVVREFIQQRPDAGEVYKPADGLALKGRTTWADILPDGTRLATREVLMERVDARAQQAAIEAMLAGFRDDLPRAEPVAAPTKLAPDLLCQYTITDSHLGALAWNEETRGGDYDLSIGVQLVLDWFSAAIAGAPPSRRAIFAQLGDFLHYDSFKSITPEHGHLLDGDTRYPKMVRAAIRVVRMVIAMLLEKHEQLDVIMCDANHDPAGEVWLREMLAAFYENEPRVRVDVNPGTYSVIEHGDVSLFYHHGHRRGVKNVDSIMVGKYREVYGRTKFSYAHTGHKHADELKTTDLMKVEQHETLAAPDAYGSNWLSGRSAKVIIYHAQFGEVGRSVLTPEMVAGAAAA